ncbi:MAG TPA: efflux RND transporter periplasmic adaptor subunit [Candidatus Methylacidiphilales bacterium]|nr:efflux RND transporter periplasmic adaptor subunit [Candidatus Methylacidiphilales bacterium]
MKTLLQIIAALVIIGAVAGGAYYYNAKPASAAAASAAKPPTPVTVQTLNERNVRLWSEFSGRMHAVDYAEIRPEVSGRITEVRFQDGQYVKAGDILFVIDPRPYAAAVERDQAALESAKSQLVRANQDEARAEGLITSHAIAQSDKDTWDNNVRTAQANVDAADAQLKQAQVDLEHAYVTAPISGRAARAEITLGNVVQAGLNAPLLSSVVSQDGIYADFEVDEQTYLDTIRGGAIGNAQEQKIPVELVAGNDTAHVYHGYMQSFDNRIDASSGTIRARARFANEDHALVPGMFVSVRLGASQDRHVLLVPNRAVGFDQSKKFVYVVDDANKVNYRPVELGKTVGEQRVVESGLNPGDRVIVGGIQYVRPNDVVDAKEVAADPLPADDTQVANK